LFRVVFECRRDQPGLQLGLDASQSHEKDSGVQQALSENEIAKIFVCG
jgi:hypothetical protein